MIRSVKVLGLESRNGRTYAPRALEEAAKLYEGKPVNVDHAVGARRSYRDRIGKLSAVALRPDGLYADLIVNPKHPLAEQLFWDAEHSPESVGLSHDVTGRTVVRGGRVVVEAIEEVRGVDLVAEPATTHGLYEDREADPDALPADDPGGDDGDADDPEHPDRLPDEAFALVLPGGVKIGDRTHPLHKRYWPLDSPERVRRALRAIAANRKLAEKHRSLAMQRARDAARKFGIDPEEVLRQQESLSMNALEDITLERLRETRPDLVEQIAAATETDKQVAAIKEERDRLAAELDAIRRKERLAAELAQAKIPSERIPASLMESLLAAEDARRQAMIGDLAALLQSPEKPTSQRAGAALPGSFEARLALWA